MEKLGERSLNRVPGPPAQASPSAMPAERWAKESRAYILTIAGPGVASSAVAQALERVACIAGDGTSPLSATARESLQRAVRDAALGEAERLARRIPRRIGRLARLRFGCARLPGLLGERAAGRSLADEPVGVHGRLDRCPHCASLTARFEAAESRLTQALSKRAGPPPVIAITRAGPRRAITPANRPAAKHSHGAGEAAVEQRAAGHSADPVIPVIPVRAIGARPALAPAHRGLSPPVRRRRTLVAGGLLLVGGCAAAFVQLVADGRHGPSVIPPISRQLLTPVPVGSATPAVGPLPGVHGDDLVIGPARSAAAPIQPVLTGAVVLGAAGFTTR